MWVLAITLVILAVRSSDALCPIGFHAANNNQTCHKKVTGNVMNVADALAGCNNINGWLVGIETITEYNDVVDAMANGPLCTSFWTGAKYKNGAWCWERMEQGSAVDTAMDFTFWKNDEEDPGTPATQVYGVIKDADNKLYSYTNIIGEIDTCYLCEADPLIEI